MMWICCVMIVKRGGYPDNIVRIRTGLRGVVRTFVLVRLIFSYFQKLFFFFFFRLLLLVVRGLLFVEYAAAGIALTSCDNSGTKFCCGPSNDCCDTGKYTQINKKTGKVVAIGTSKVATSTTATHTSSSSTAAAATGGTTSGADATNTSSGDSGGMSEQTKLGIGLGVGLGVPFLGATAAALFLWRRSSMSKARGGYDASSPDEMAKVANSPGTGPGSPPVPEYGQDAADVGAAAAVGTEGGEVELGDNTLPKPVYQLEAETNTRTELGDDRRVFELQ